MLSLLVSTLKVNKNVKSFILLFCCSFDRCVPFFSVNFTGSQLHSTPPSPHPPTLPKPSITSPLLFTHTLVCPQWCLDLQLLCPPPLKHLQDHGTILSLFLITCPKTHLSCVASCFWSPPDWLFYFLCCVLLLYPLLYTVVLICICLFSSLFTTVSWRWVLGKVPTDEMHYYYYLACILCYSTLYS